MRDGRPVARGAGDRGGRDPRHGAGRARRADRPARRPATSGSLQAAAVVGRVFWPGPVARADRATPARSWTTRCGASRSASSCCSRPGSTLAGQPEYIFKHILTRDVAYESPPACASARRRTLRSAAGSSGPRAIAPASSPSCSPTTTRPPPTLERDVGALRSNPSCAERRSDGCSAPPRTRGDGSSSRRRSGWPRRPLGFARSRVERVDALDDARRSVLRRLRWRPRLAVLP